MGLSEGERISMIRSAVLIQYTRVTDRQTDGRTELAWHIRAIAYMLSRVKSQASCSLLCAFFYRAMHYSAKCGLAIACHRSVCLFIVFVCPSIQRRKSGPKLEAQRAESGAWGSWGESPGKFEIWCNLRPQNSLQKCLIMCKSLSYQGLESRWRPC